MSIPVFINNCWNERPYMKGEGEELNNDEGNLDDHAKRLLELYDRKYRSFENYFSILVGISVSVFFFLLFPFVSAQDMKHKVIENIAHTNMLFLL